MPALNAAKKLKDIKENKMIRQEIKEIAKIIHKVEFPNSSCWDNCNKCFYKSNCNYLKAAEALFNEGWRKQAKGEWIERRWTTEDDWGYFNHRSIECSNCHVEIYKGNPTDYCPKCGAEMVGRR